MNEETPQPPNRGVKRGQTKTREIIPAQTGERPEGADAGEQLPGSDLPPTADTPPGDQAADPPPVPLQNARPKWALANGNVLVRVVKQPVGENGKVYLKGETFEISGERAAALGPLIEPAE